VSSILSSKSRQTVSQLEKREEVMILKVGILSKDEGIKTVLVKRWLLWDKVNKINYGTVDLNSGEGNCFYDETQHHFIPNAIEGEGSGDGTRGKYTWKDKDRWVAHIVADRWPEEESVHNCNDIAILTSGPAYLLNDEGQTIEKIN